ncbi:dephospho-CoA kinase [Micromonospora sp. WMMD1120]|uniref:dephospho-CoA kinase n=1 Tax=Micromonospora sp. WMMD1120 TaxID=3016106 RepID=UPI0024169CDE|nr:dephospho-CoA kinase [Micromonospora sp. WMMD1120]MDG4805206.1 dephospho-CoA kinase [Micromonospora sp. WMMD1120]
MLRVGLTGGIGSGKSAVAARLAERGAVVIDADQVAREVVAPGTDGLIEIVAAFSDAVLDADGALDRAALGAVVFADADARRRLEAIVHPRVRARTAELIAAAAPDAIVVNDVPLLVETGLAPTYHLVVVVQTAAPIRLERLARDRGMSRAEAERRIAAQADDARRRAAADVVLTNDDSLTALHDAVDALWRQRLRPYEDNLRQRRVIPPSRRAPAEADASWPEQYARLAARIRHALGAEALRIDHIGATAVPGLAAQDVIDIQVAVSSLADADGALADRLAGAGFPRVPGEWWDDPRPAGRARWRKRLHGSADPARPVRLHVRVADSPGWRYALLMRDHLRADPDQRSAYLLLKRDLVDAAPEAGDSGTARDPWFDEEYLRAEQWAAQTDWRP